MCIRDRPQAARETARQPAVKIESAFFMVSSSQIYASLTGIHYAAQLSLIHISGEEGCLSVPGKSGVVTRPNYVKVRAFDEDMKEIVLEGEGLLALSLIHICRRFREKRRMPAIQNMKSLKRR